MRKHCKNMRHRTASKKSRKVFCHDNSNAHNGQKGNESMIKKGSTNAASNPKSLGDLGDAALRFAGLGLHVLPLEPEAKRPASITVTGVFAATTDADQIRRWWTANSLFNVAIACGVSNIAVLDIDGGAGEVGFAELESKLGKLPDTTTVLTPGRGGGRHLIFEGCEELFTMVGIASGVDFKAAGGYIVTVPSVHPDGGTYQFEEGKSFDEKSPSKLPPQWIDYLQRLWSEREDVTYQSNQSVTSSGATSSPIESHTINISIGSIGTIAFGK